jgi:hypothetical protein
MKKPWFLRSFFVLIPVTLQGFLFEAAIVAIVLAAGGKGFDILETNRPVANFYLAIAVISMAVFWAIGLYKSRPIGRPPR